MAKNFELEILNILTITWGYDECLRLSECGKYVAIDIHYFEVHFKTFHLESRINQMNFRNSNWIQSRSIEIKSSSIESLG